MQVHLTTHGAPPSLHAYHFLLILFLLLTSSSNGSRNKKLCDNFCSPTKTMGSLLLRQTKHWFVKCIGMFHSLPASHLSASFLPASHFPARFQKHSRSKSSLQLISVCSDAVASTPGVPNGLPSQDCKLQKFTRGHFPPLSSPPHFKHTGFKFKTFLAGCFPCFALLSPACSVTGFVRLRNIVQRSCPLSKPKQPSVHRQRKNNIISLSDTSPLSRLHPSRHFLLDRFNPSHSQFVCKIKNCAKKIRVFLETVALLSVHLFSPNKHNNNNTTHPPSYPCQQCTHPPLTNLARPRPLPVAPLRTLPVVPLPTLPPIVTPFAKKWPKPSVLFPTCQQTMLPPSSHSGQRLPCK